MMNYKIQKISTNLWFDQQAEEAAQYYTAIFPDSSIGRITRYGQERHESQANAEGQIMTVEFQLAGQTFVALNGGPHFKFNEAISFIVHCEDQDELDYYWDKLADGGDERAQVCGWLKDRFGVSWQVVPAALTAMLTDSDAVKSERVMKVLLATKNKIEIAKLIEAYKG